MELGSFQVFGMFAFFVLGTIIGSFLNVVIFRHNTGVGVSGRSRCPSCARSILWYDLIPVWSFLLLRGRCRFCRSRFSFQYPAVEFVTGLLFAASFWKFFGSATGFMIFNAAYYLSFLLVLVVMSTLVVIFVYDLKHKIIPDGFVYLFISLSLLYALLSPASPIFSPQLTTYQLINLSTISAGPLIALPIFLIWLLSGGWAMGFGDVKLALGMGWFLGFAAGLSALILGFWSGAAVGLFLVFLPRLKTLRRANAPLSSGVKKFTMKSEVPFAPFLILGLLLAYFLNINLI